MSGFVSNDVLVDAASRPRFASDSCIVVLNFGAWILGAPVVQGDSSIELDVAFECPDESEDDSLDCDVDAPGQVDDALRTFDFFSDHPINTGDFHLDALLQVTTDLPTRATCRNVPSSVGTPTHAAASAPATAHNTAHTLQTGAEELVDASRGFTTVVLRNIPNNYTRDMLLAMFDVEFQSAYDFVYLPIDLRRRSCLGYAFVNLISHSEAMRFKSAFKGFQSWRCRSSKTAVVEWAQAGCQGQQHHIDRLRNKAMMRETYPDMCKAVTFESGQRVQFPAPTKGKGSI